jgi:hypothetical protein
MHKASAGMILIGCPEIPILQRKSRRQSRDVSSAIAVSSDCFIKLIVLIGIFRGKFEPGA